MGLIIVIKLSLAKGKFPKFGERYITIYRSYKIHTLTSALTPEEAP